jgi:putative endonuclease
MGKLIVYILKCSDQSYYTGVTNDIERRLYEHNEGMNTTSYTFLKRPVQLVWQKSFQSKIEALEWEKKIKGWTRKKKEALIEAKFNLLHELAECKNESHFKNRKSCFDSAQHDHESSEQHDRKQIHRSP